MFRKDSPPSEVRMLLINLITICATLAGLCVAGISVLNANGKAPFIGLADDILAFAGMLFLFCTYLIFWALKQDSEKRLVALAKIIDIAFLSALSLVVISGFGIVYAIF